MKASVTTEQLDLWAAWRILTPLWFALAVVGSCFTYAIHASEVPRYTWLHAARINFLSYSLWAVILTPVVVWLCAHIPLQPRRLSLVVPAHVLAMFAIAVVNAFLRSVLHRFAYPDGVGVPIASRFHWYFFANAEGDLFLYWATAVTAYVVAYQSKLRDRELRAAHLETQLATGKLQMLRMQLQPHFLFNTLHSIAGLVREDADRAERMISSLGDFLRLSLDTASVQEVTLERELNLIRYYLDIQRIRFYDRLQVELNTGADSLDACVPYLVLQPLIENAIKYGIEQRSAPGTIEIESAVEGEWLTLRVVNDIAIERSPRTTREGIGLSTTRARLTGLYGSNQLFSYGELDGAKFQVEVRVPLKRQMAAADTHP